MRFIHKVLSLSCLILWSFSAYGQEEAPDLSLSSPYNTVYAHLYYLQSENYEPSKAAMTIYGIKDAEVARAKAIKIKQVLDAKGLKVILSTLPTETNFRDTHKQNIYKLFPEEAPLIFVKKYGNRWYYSAETVEAIDALHAKVYPVGSEFLLNILPRFGSTLVLGLKVWQWIGASLFVVISFLLFRLFALLLNLIIKALTRTRFGKDFLLEHKAAYWKIARTASLLLIFELLELFLPVLQFPIGMSKFMKVSLGIFQTVFIVLLLLGIIDLVMKYLKKIVELSEGKMDDQLLPILKKLAQVIIVVFGLIQILDSLNVNVTALIAGVSIGGLAIALAAQETVKNLIGSLMIFVDKPFKVGDFIEVNGVAGTIREVGFRSTRIQSADTSIISMPNGQLANFTINNLGIRSYRRIKMTLGITYSSPPEKIDLFVEGIREILARMEIIREEGVQVYLNNFNASSLDILVIAYVITSEWSEELGVKHKIMLHIIKLADALDIHFAFPSQSLYLENLSSELKKDKIIIKGNEDLKTFLDSLLPEKSKEDSNASE